MLETPQRQSKHRDNGTGQSKMSNHHTDVLHVKKGQNLTAGYQLLEIEQDHS